MELALLDLLLGQEGVNDEDGNIESFRLESELAMDIDHPLDEESA